MALKSYVVLIDPSFEQVVKAHQAMPDALVFSFITNAEDGKIDWPQLPKSDNLVWPVLLSEEPEEDWPHIVTTVVQRALDEL